MQEITNDEINQNNQFTQESKFVYVDVNSENVDEDGSLEAPYKTLNNENLEKISDNSTVYVSKGTYPLNTINIQKNISVVGENRDQVIFVPNVNTTVFIIDVETTVTFSNFTFKNYESDSNSAIVNNKTDKTEYYSYEYDIVGNMTSKANILSDTDKNDTVYTYNALDQLVTATTSNIVSGEQTSNKTYTSCILLPFLS